MNKQFAEFSELSQKEIERLKSQRFEVESAISTLKSNLDDLSIDYRRPSTTSSHRDPNQTLNSNFTMETVDVEDLK